MCRYPRAVTPQPVIHPNTSPTRQRKRQRTSLYLSAVVIALGLLAAIGGFWWAGRTPSTAQAEPPDQSQPFGLRGYATLRLPDFTWTSGPPEVCLGMGLYRDVRQDTPVVVTDQSGTTIATGVLGFGEPVRSATDASKATACKLPLYVSNVPADRQFYKVSIGDRKAVDFNQFEIKGNLEIAID